jgi:prenyltransferase beta subunit
MLQVARLAPKLLGESTPLVLDFFLRQQHHDGGFRDRSGRSDLYYTVFGIEGLLALQAPLPVSALVDYLGRFQEGSELDFIHLCCLARCRAAVGEKDAPASWRSWVQPMRERLEHFRSGDGGYSVTAGAARGTAYACFMALAAYQDLRLSPPASDRVLACVQTLATPDGAWGNEAGLKAGATNATAAAITLLRQLRVSPPAGLAEWLLAQRHPQGGFRAAPNAPLPDLLSTATALHALAGLERTMGDGREDCLDFVDTLWSNEGGFHGHWGDDFLDCEYTYYGLLALGHLSLE